MDSDTLGVRQVFRFKRPKGFFGRFTFNDFVNDSGLSILLTDEDNTIQRDDLQRLYNDLTKLWMKKGLIEAVGHKARKGQKGRRMVVYEPNTTLNFTLGAEGIYEDALKTIIRKLQDGLNKGKDAEILHQSVYESIELAKSVLSDNGENLSIN